MRFLLEDLILKKISPTEVECLPTGVDAYYERVLESIERDGEASDRTQTQGQFRVKVQLLEQLVSRGDLSRERFNQLCKQHRESLPRIWGSILYRASRAIRFGQRAS